MTFSRVDSERYEETALNLSHVSDFARPASNFLMYLHNIFKVRRLLSMYLGDVVPDVTQICEFVTHL